MKNLPHLEILNIGLGRFSTWGGGAQAITSEASRPNACEWRSRGSGGWPPSGGCKGAAVPPCLRKFCILRAKYASFQALFSLDLQKYMIFGGRKGPALLFVRECIWWNYKCTISVLFFFKIYTLALWYDIGGCKGKASPFLRKFCIILVS